MENIFNFAFKYLYFFALLPLPAILLIDYWFQPFNEFYISDNSLSGLSGIAASFLGFLLTALTIVLSIPKESKYMKLLKRFNHHKIFGRIVVVGVIMFVGTIVFWFLGEKFIRLAFYSFCGGLFEVIAAFYYSYRMIVDNF